MTPRSSGNSLGTPRSESVSAVERRGSQRRSLSADDRDRAQENGTLQEAFPADVAGRWQSTGSEKNGKALNSIVSALLSSTRETDIIGWYKDRTTVGVMFTGLVSMTRTRS